MVQQYWDYPWIFVSLNCSIQRKQISNINDLVKEYPEQFDRIGKLPGLCHITVDPKIPPKIHAVRKFPIQLKQKLIHELQRLENLNIICRVTEPTDWVNSMAISIKGSGDLRLCLDPKDLNNAIMRPHHKTPTLEEITYRLQGAKFFSKLDAKDGYWSITLDEESSLLTNLTLLLDDTVFLGFHLA